MTPRVPDQSMAVPRHVWRHTVSWGCAAGLGVWVTAISHLPVVYCTGAWLLAGVISMVTVFTQSAYTPLGGLTGFWGVLFLPGFLIFARVHGPYHWITVSILVGGTAVLIFTAVHMWTNMLEIADAARRAREAANALAELRKWSRMFEVLGVPGVITERAEKTRAGEDVFLQLPQTGKTKLSRLQDLSENIAIRLGLTEDSVSFERYDQRNARLVVMHINRLDIMAETVPFPHFTEPLTIMRPLPVGLLSGGQPIKVSFREVQAMVVGYSGSGKSNLFNVLTALLTLCPDAVVWMIDFKRGRLAAPWLRPYAEGRTPRPAIDWLATSREEAERMLRAFDRVSEARMASLRGGSAIDPDASMPQIILLSDESTDIIGAGKLKSEQVDTGASNSRLGELANRITRKVRSEAMQCVWGFQRATITMTGSGDLKSQCALRFVLRVLSMADAQAAIPDDVRAQQMLVRLKHPGTGLVWTPDVRGPQPVKFYKLDPRDAADERRIGELATVAGHSRPLLHPIDTAAIGEDYAGRWERCDLLAMLRNGGAVPPAGDSPEPAAEPGLQGRPVATMERPRNTRGSEMQETWRELTGRLTADAPMDIPPLPRATESNPAYLRIHAWLADRGQGMAVEEMLAGLNRDPDITDVPARETIHRWMNKDIKAGKVERRHGRYYLRKDREQG